jgi:hypothetical protein
MYEAETAVFDTECAKDDGIFLLGIAQIADWTPAPIGAINIIAMAVNARPREVATRLVHAASAEQYADADMAGRLTAAYSGSSPTWQPVVGENWNRRVFALLAPLYGFEPLEFEDTTIGATARGAVQFLPAHAVANAERCIVVLYIGDPSVVDPYSVYPLVHVNRTEYFRSGRIASLTFERSAPIVRTIRRMVADVIPGSISSTDRTERLLPSVAELSAQRVVRHVTAQLVTVGLMPMVAACLVETSVSRNPMFVPVAPSTPMHGVPKLAIGALARARISDARGVARYIASTAGSRALMSAGALMLDGACVGLWWMERVWHAAPGPPPHGARHMRVRYSPLQIFEATRSGPRIAAKTEKDAFETYLGVPRLVAGALRELDSERNDRGRAALKSAFAERERSGGEAAFKRATADMTVEDAEHVRRLVAIASGHDNARQRFSDLLDSAAFAFDRVTAMRICAAWRSDDGARVRSILEPIVRRAASDSGVSAHAADVTEAVKSVRVAVCTADNGRLGAHLLATVDAAVRRIERAPGERIVVRHQ